MLCYRAHTEKVVWRVVDGEAVLVHADTSAYYGLNAAATCIWEALVSASLSREDIGRRLGARYNVDADTLLSDVASFLAIVERESLIIEMTPSNGHLASESPASDAHRQGGRYERPSLTRFGELEKLVLSGE
jgi:hypothetical protein